MVKARRFTKLFEPVRIGDMEIKNRIVMPGMGTHFASKDGYITELTKAWYRERSKGGAGLVIVETSIIHPSGRSMLGEIMISDDSFIPGLKELANAIKENGARAAIQLNHTGCHATTNVAGAQPVAASAIAEPPNETPRALSVNEIKEMVQRYASAAVRAKKAGFDGVEIHAAHHYLLSGFLSSTLNQRKDEYGGNLNNRARFLQEVILAVRQSVGPNYPVWCRLDGQIYGEGGGITINEAEEFARIAERAGAQAIHVSAHSASPHYAYFGCITLIPGCFVPLASRIKKVVKVPVITVGWISPSLAEKILKEGKADLVAMGRAHIADPNLASKLAAGKLPEVQTCIRCQQCVNEEREHMACSVNPLAGNEAEFKLVPTGNPKEVLVVGGGPAGMKAAIVAATRGHKVTLCERRPRLGGSLLVGAIFSQPLEELAESFVNQMRSRHIDIKLSTEVTPELIAEIKPQVVIVATGGIHLTPELPGVEGKNVIHLKDIYGLVDGSMAKRNGSSGRLLFRLGSLFFRYFYMPSIIPWLLKRGFFIGKRVIIIGGQIGGLEIGAILSDMGRKVIIVEPSERTGEGLSPLMRLYYGDKILNGGGIIMTGAKLERITPKGLVITGNNGVREDLVGDTVLLALKAKPDSRQVKALQGKAPEVYTVGDCVEPQNVLEATQASFRVALAI
jgi:2,4-dienoyl-CoA reductase-like NADH-dependent reductase (Old Yellow Enzyme family)/thioredoxin reductase